MNALFVDFSSFQNPVLFNWLGYKAWSAAADGISRICLRDDQGVGVKDSAFEQFWSGAIANGIDEIFVYHYAYPNLHPGPAGAVQEAQSMEQVIGSRLRARDKVMLDLEQNEYSVWAIAFGQEMLKWHPTASKPVLYDSLAHIKQFLQDPQLAVIFDLAMADWTYDPNSRPAAPYPWQAYAWLQYTDRLTADWYSGGAFDANVFLGEEIMSVPTGWTDDPATETLTAPNGQSARYGMRKFVLANNWQANNAPYGPEYTYGTNPGDTRQDYLCCSLLYTANNEQIVYAPVGQELKDCQARPAGDPQAAAAKAALKAWLAE